MRWHVVGLALVVAVALAVTPLDWSWTSDDGAYVRGARLVREEGRWHEDRPELDLADHPERYPYVLSDVDEEGRAFPYVKNPAWIWVLVASTTVLGERLGNVAPGVLGLVAAAVVAWALARRLGARSPWVAFWLAGAGPLLVGSLVGWAHVVAAALAGAAALLVVRLVEGRSVAAAVGAGACLAGVALVRTEGALLVAATVLAVLLLGPGPWLDVRRLRDPLVVGAVGALGFVVDRAWAAALVSGSTTSTSGSGTASSWLAGRASAAWTTLGSSGDAGPVVQVLGVSAAVLLVGAVVAGARGVPGRAVGAVVGLGVAMAAARVALEPLDLVSGLAPAWPAAIGGAVVWVVGAAGGERRRPELALALLCGAFVGALLLVQYPEGGGVEWGGRFFTPLAVPVAALAAVGVERLAARGPEGAAGRRVAAGAAAVVATGAVSVTGLVATRAARLEVGELVAAAHAADADAVVAEGEFLPRFDLRDPPAPWVRPGRDGLAATVRDRLDAGAGRVAVVGRSAPTLEVPGTAREVLGRDVAVFTDARHGG